MFGLGASIFYVVLFTLTSFGGLYTLVKLSSGISQCMIRYSDTLPRCAVLYASCYTSNNDTCQMRLSVDRNRVDLRTYVCLGEVLRCPYKCTLVLHHTCIYSSSFPPFVLLLSYYISTLDYLLFIYRPLKSNTMPQELTTVGVPQSTSGTSSNPVVNGTKVEFPENRVNHNHDYPCKDRPCSCKCNRWGCHPQDGVCTSEASGVNGPILGKIGVMMAGTAYVIGRYGL